MGGVDHQMVVPLRLGVGALEDQRSGQVDRPGHAGFGVVRLGRDPEHPLGRGEIAGSDGDQAQVEPGRGDRVGAGHPTSAQASVPSRIQFEQ